MKNNKKYISDGYVVDVTPQVINGYEELKLVVGNKYEVRCGYLMEYSADRIQELAAEKTYEARVRIIPDKSNLQIFGEVYEGLEELEKMGYPINDMTCVDLKKLLYKKIVD